MRLSATLCLLLVMVRTSDQRDTIDLDVDCRFWEEPKQSRANMIVNRKKDKEGSVFYYWDSTLQSCSPCSLCPERTLSHCSYVRDTVCVSQREWLHRGLGSLDELESKLRNSGQTGTRDEGVVILRSDADRNDEKVRTGWDTFRVL